MIGIVSVSFDVTDQLSIRFFFAFVRYWEKSGSTIRLHQLFVNFKKADDSVTKEELYNIHTESGVPMKLVRLIKLCLNKICIKVRIGKQISDKFPIQNGMNDEMLYRHCFPTLLYNMALEKSRKSMWN
jgi:hypothetical protein